MTVRSVNNREEKDKLRNQDKGLKRMKSLVLMIFNLPENSPPKCTAFVEVRSL